MRLTAAPAGPTSLRLLLVDPIYRSFVVVLLLYGIAAGCSVPFISLWATEVLHADTVQTGLLRTIAGLGGVVFSLAFGAVSDRTLKRRRWLVGALGVGTVAWIGLAATRQYALGAFLYMLTSLGGYTLIFALLGDWLRYRQPTGVALLNNGVRFAFALGWVIGPTLGGTVIEWLGYTALFATTAIAQGLSTVLAVRGLRDVPTNEVATTVASEGSSPSPDTVAHGYGPLALFTLAMFCVFAAGPGRMVLLPLYVTQELDAPVRLVGTLFTIGVGCELPLFLLVGRLADRYGSVRLLFVGMLAQVIYFGALAVSHSYWQIAAVEPFFSLTMTTVNGVGMLYVQTLVPRRAGTAIAFYNVTLLLGPVVAAPLLAYLAEQAGYVSTFAASGVLSVLALGAFLASLRTRAHTSGPRPDPSRAHSAR